MNKKKKLSISVVKVFAIQMLYCLSVHAYMCTQMLHDRVMTMAQHRPWIIQSAVALCQDTFTLTNSGTRFAKQAHVLKYSWVADICKQVYN